jgi:amidohydrolase
VSATERRWSIEPTEAERAELVEIRRDLHRNPELQYAVHRTAGVVTERLRGLGLSPVEGVGRSGVTAVIEGESPGPCVMLRADMDALPIQEENDADYRSTVDGRMHACGHDCHVSIGLTTAKALLRAGGAPRGAVKLVFQPAEEGGNGALAMVEDGVLASPTVDAAFGLHVWNHLDVGKVAVVDGPFMGAVDQFRIRVAGRGGHGAMPHETRDPVVAAAAVVTALQQIASRRVDPLDSVVVTVGRIAGGEAFNVIPPHVDLEGTLRCFSDGVWDHLPGWVEEVATRTAEAYGCRAEVDVQRLMRATVNDAAMAGLVREVAAEVVGPENVVEMRTLGSEDFSEFLQRVPGCYFFVGSRNEAKGFVHPHHSPRFDVDEAVLPIGVEMLAGVARRYLAG